ncbi:MAG: cytoplasmic protein [Gammaproteobacteria bacterium]|nr:cytoplasmic protein [Gammaproteobacteria bacterium]
MEASENCCCISCLEFFPPSEIRKWWDDGRSACCPKCGLTHVVVGSESGLPFNKYYLGMAGGHLIN